MKWLGSALILVALSSAALAQEPKQAAGAPTASAPINPGTPSPATFDNGSTAFGNGGQAESVGGFLNGNHNFPNFIGFMANPLYAIDPRAMTAVTPLNLNAWTSGPGRLPDGFVELPGAALSVALSDRLSMGLNQGGFVFTHFNRERDGWLDLGGYVQYTLIQDVPNQFLLTTGLHWDAPMGSKEVFQGRAPADLAPYVTAGKECGDYHALASFGYQFPAGSSNVSTTFFFGTVHLDRRCFGWLYPLIEFNWVAHNTTVNLNPDFFQGIIDLGTFSGSGNLVTLTVGANAVLVPEKLEFGAGYTTSIASQRGFDVNALIVKAVIRY